MNSLGGLLSSFLQEEIELESIINTSASTSGKFLKLMAFCFKIIYTQDTNIICHIVITICENENYEKKIT